MGGAPAGLAGAGQPESRGDPRGGDAAGAAGGAHRPDGGHGCSVPRRIDGHGRGHLSAQSGIRFLQRRDARRDGRVCPGPAGTGTADADPPPGDRRRHRRHQCAGVRKAAALSTAHRGVLLHRRLPGIPDACPAGLRAGCAVPQLSAVRCRQAAGGAGHRGRRLRCGDRHQCPARDAGSAADGQKRQGCTETERPGDDQRDRSQRPVHPPDVRSAQGLVAVRRCGSAAARRPRARAEAVEAGAGKRRVSARPFPGAGRSRSRPADRDCREQRGDLAGPAQRAGTGQGCAQGAGGPGFAAAAAEHRHGAGGRGDPRRAEGSGGALSQGGGRRAVQDPARADRCPRAAGDVRDRLDPGGAADQPAARQAVGDQQHAVLRIPDHRRACRSFCRVAASAADGAAGAGSGSGG